MDTEQPNITKKKPIVIGSRSNAIKEIKYLCFLCYKEIKSKGFDISAVILITNWDKEKKQRSQQFFCHIDCFSDIVHDEIPIDIIQDDFE